MRLYVFLYRLKKRAYFWFFLFPKVLLKSLKVFFLLFLQYQNLKFAFLNFREVFREEALMEIYRQDKEMIFWYLTASQPRDPSDTEWYEGFLYSCRAAYKLGLYQPTWLALKIRARYLPLGLNLSVRELEEVLRGGEDLHEYIFRRLKCL